MCSSKQVHSLDNYSVCKRLLCEYHLSFCQIKDTYIRCLDDCRVHKHKELPLTIYTAHVRKVFSNVVKLFKNGSILSFGFACCFSSSSAYWSLLDYILHVAMNLLLQAKRSKGSFKTVLFQHFNTFPGLHYPDQVIHRFKGEQITSTPTIAPSLVICTQPILDTFHLLLIFHSSYIKHHYVIL